MSPTRPRQEPLLVVLGSTGTGKSDLAVELACRFNGEIINADAMQMYKGLPIITNKISVEEQRGIPHHLLGNIELEDDTWVVGNFKREASKIIRDIRSRGKLPIVVGGTHYYTDALLFDNRVVQADQANRPDTEVAAQDEILAQHPILAAPTGVILSRLREVDPVMADQWHPSDRRKIQRSLEIYLTTGKRASDIYAEQRKQREARGSAAQETPWQSLLFWVHSERETLVERLNKRVDKMIATGLLDETNELYSYLQRKETNGEAVQRSRGIWQSIGFKEFEPYLEGLKAGDRTPEELAKLHSAAVESTKGATRRYAKYQIRWISTKLVPFLKEANAEDHLFVLDSTDLGQWKTNVVDKAAELTKNFLHNEPLPAPGDLSDAAHEVLISAAGRKTQESPCRKVCEVCQATLLTEERWQKHIKGRSHRNSIKSAKKRALVVVEQHDADTDAPLPDSGES